MAIRDEAGTRQMAPATELGDLGVDSAACANKWGLYTVSILLRSALGTWVHLSLIITSCPPTADNNWGVMPAHLFTWASIISNSVVICFGGSRAIAKQLIKHSRA
jgi:hypothetical protein